MKYIFLDTLILSFSVEHAAKDYGIALQPAEQQGLDLPLARTTHAQYRRLVEIGKVPWINRPFQN
ncbi:MAG: hypothetical protein ABGX83_09200 [Nitrospira sp.]|nr:NAD(P)-dependent oxidoreductase [Candidatus Manganitrophaceae bacterium]HIL34347.1 NAD(P)-dependent oxidoreductase [Candidatus Manganitrophaceae bacterium]